jgi:hypothetical protein
MNQLKSDINSFRLFGIDRNLFWILLMLMSSCQSKNNERNTAEQISKDSASIMMTQIARDVSEKGPIAWLDYFEDGPDFFMASEGGLAFKDYPSAKIFIENTLVKSIKHIDLRWDHERVDPLNSSMASVAADFHEELTDSTGKTVQEQGFFTGIAEQTTSGWQLRNAHWSVIRNKEAN